MVNRPLGTPSLLMRRLAEVTEFRFRGVTNGQKSGWAGSGTGTVQAALIDATILSFVEAGSWVTEEGREFDFNNIYRWTQLPDGVRLEHLRFAPQKPVYLFDLQPISETKWVSAEPHVCQEDCYRAELILEENQIELCWRVIGPEKDEMIRYAYT